MQQFNLLFPLFLIVIFGILSVKLKLIPKDAYINLNKVVIFIAMPALTISALMNVKTEDLSKFPMFTLANTVAMVALSLLLFFTLRIFKLPYEKMAASFESLMEGNVVYLGYPIILGLMGETHLAYASVFVATTLQIAAMINAFLLTSKMGGKISLGKILVNYITNPLVLSTIIGFVIFFVIQMFPAVTEVTLTLNTAVTRLGSMASTLALFSLGVFLYSNFKINSIKISLITALARLLIVPAFILLVTLYIFKLDQVSVETSVLLASMPTAIFAIMASDVYKYDKNQASNTLILSSILFSATLPLWLWVLDQVF